jgi:uncharacterized repeat protein (TIGR01451 family)
MGDTASSYLNYAGNIDGIHIAHLRVGDILYDFEPDPIIPVVVAPPSPAIGIFDPAISKIGFLLPGQVGLSDEQLEWIVTVSNLGDAPGNNVVVTDTLGTALQIDNVDAPGATVNISGQTVTVTYATINPGDTVQFSIFTTVLDGAIMINTACVANLTQASGEECATALPISILPRTGELPERNQ